MTELSALYRPSAPASCGLSLAALAFAASLLWSSAAVAQPQPDVSDEAEAHYQRGVKLYQEGSYDRASEELREAYSLTPAPMLLYNISVAEWRSGDLEAALSAGYRASSEGVPEAIAPKLSARLRAFESVRSGRRVAGNQGRAGDRAPRTDRSGGRGGGLGTQGWIGVSLAASGVAALGGAFGIDRHLKSESEEFERAAARGDGETYARKYEQLVRRQRTGLVLLGAGALAASTGAALLIADASGESEASDRDRRAATFSLAPGIRGGTLRIEFW